MRRIVLIVTLALALGACGTTDWNAAHGPEGAKTVGRAKTATGKKAAAAARAAAAAEKPYVDALVAGTLTSPDTDPGMDAATVRCVATAVVHGYGTKALEAAGLSPNALRSPDVSFDGLDDPTEAQITSIGGALQRCKIGSPLATAILEGMHVTDPAAPLCLSHALDSDPQARRFLVDMLLGHEPGLGSTHAIVAVLAKCLDLAKVAIEAADIQADPAVQACFLTQLRGVQAALEDYLALRMSGSDPQSALEASGEMSVALNRCRPGANTGFAGAAG